MLPSPPHGQLGGLKHLGGGEHWIGVGHLSNGHFSSEKVAIIMIINRFFSVNINAVYLSDA